MRIAVIGAGVSGLVTAYLLRERHEVRVFERNAYAGGHANTVTVEGADGRELPLDVGFIVYAPRTYPGFRRLLRELGVATQPSEMSFSLRWEEHDAEFSSRGLRGYFATPRNAARWSHYRVLLDLLRFHRESRAALERDELHEVTFDDFLRRGGYSEAFRERLIVPLTAATWSNAPDDVRGFPANYLFRFLEQHGVLGVGQIPEWRWLRGGSRSYVQRIVAALPSGAVRLGASVRGARRLPEGGVCLEHDAGEERFDAVVLACHAPEALGLLRDASSAEREALEGFRYASNHVVLHTDERVLPRRPWARSAWNYLAAREGDPGTLTMTYDLNRLQRIPGDTHYCVSVNPLGRVRPERVIAEFEYEHPVFSMASRTAQGALEAINGERDTWFAGAYLGYGFHEDGVQAGVRVARALGGRW